MTDRIEPTQGITPESLEAAGLVRPGFVDALFGAAGRLGRRLAPDEYAAMLREWQVTQPIEPALSDEEWADRQVWGADGQIALSIDDETTLVVADAFGNSARLPDDHHEAAIALLNDLLPDGDRRKFTHRTVAMLRDAARVAELEGLEYRDLLALAEGLASYLPPEPDEVTVYPRLDAALRRKLDERL